MKNIIKATLLISILSIWSCGSETKQESPGQTETESETGARGITDPSNETDQSGEADGGMDSTHTPATEGSHEGHNH